MWFCIHKCLIRLNRQNNSNLFNFINLYIYILHYLVKFYYKSLMHGQVICTKRVSVLLTINIIVNFCYIIAYNERWMYTDLNVELLLMSVSSRKGVHILVQLWTSLHSWKRKLRRIWFYIISIDDHCPTGIQLGKSNWLNWNIDNQQVQLDQLDSTGSRYQLFSTGSCYQLDSTGSSYQYFKTQLAQRV